MSRHDNHHKKHEQKVVTAPSPGQFPVPNQNLAEAKVVYQVYTQIWDPATGLRAGTIFPELYRPYETPKD
ncbi:MAG TPA: spore coat associated protein CotJA [Bacillota bacterium]|nr:spore coat associated protein CotJA [Bacillota bacterium]